MLCIRGRTTPPRTIELDPVAVEQDVRDVERVGDDRQPAVDELAGELEGRACRCRWRSSCSSRDAAPRRRAAMRRFASRRGSPRGGPSRRSATGSRRRRSARAGPRGRGAGGRAGSWTASTPRSSASSATLARPSARRCSTRRASALRSLHAQHLADSCARSVNVARCAICAHARAVVAHERCARYALRRPYDAARWPTCSAPVRGLDAVRSARRHVRRARARPPPEPAQGAAARRSRRRSPYAEMVEFKRAVVRALAPSATGILLDPEIGVGAGDRGRVAARPGRASSSPSRRPATRARRRRGSAACCPAGASSRSKRIGRIGRQAARLLPPRRARTPPTRSASSPTSRAACRDADLALFLEPLSFGLDGGEARRRGAPARSSSRPRAG